MVDKLFKAGDRPMTRANDGPIFFYHNSAYVLLDKSAVESAVKL